MLYNISKLAAGRGPPFQLQQQPMISHTSEIEARGSIIGRVRVRAARVVILSSILGGLSCQTCTIIISAKKGRVLIGIDREPSCTIRSITGPEMVLIGESPRRFICEM